MSKISYESILDCDMNWVLLMNNKLVVADIMKHITKNSKYSFRGAAIIGKSMNTLVDEETMDLIDLTLDVSMSHITKKRQQIYVSVKDFFTTNPPLKTKSSIYLFGDANGDEEYLDVHWNALVIDSNKAIWFDPACQQGDKFPMFNIQKLTSIFAQISVPVRFVFARDRPQQVLCHREEGVDVFCQTWVLMFSDMVVQNRMGEFLSTDFVNQQNIVLKKWVSNLLRKIPEYSYYSKLELYQHFFTHTRHQKDYKCFVSYIINE